VFSVTSVAGLFSPAVVRKGLWQSEIGVGVAIGIGIEWRREGIRTWATGYRNRIVAVLTQLGREA